MTNLFVWDFHGVLEKGNEHAVHEITQKVLKNFGHNKKITIEEIKKLYGLPWEEYFKSFIPLIEERELNLMLENCYEIAWPYIERHIKPNDHAKEVLEEIVKRDENIVASNSSSHAIKKFIQIVGLEDYFSTLIACVKYGRLKETKANAIRRYLRGKSFERIFMIGDTEADIEAGIKINATTILYSRTPKDTKADYIVFDLREVLDIKDGDYMGMTPSPSSH